MITLNTPPKPGRLVSRRVFLTLIQTASRIGQYRFAHQTALSWITTFPGDLPVTLLLGEALYKDKRPDLALPILDRLSQTDPEYREAVELRLEVESSTRDAGAAPSSGSKTEQKGYSASKPSELHQWALALGSRSNKIAKGVEPTSTWGETLYQVRKSIPGPDTTADMEALINAELEVHQVLAVNPETPLAAVTHLEILRSKVNEGIAPIEALRSLSEYYLTRFPNCLQCRLLLADSLIYGGDPEKAVGLLHRVAANDVTGQVIKRLLGENHPYRSLWPTDLEAAFEIPIPSAVASVLGWNQLVVGAPGEVQATACVSSPIKVEPAVSEPVIAEPIKVEPKVNEPIFLNELEAVEVTSSVDQNKQPDIDLDEIEIAAPAIEFSKPTIPAVVSKDVVKAEQTVETKPSEAVVKTETINECTEDTSSSELPEMLKSVQQELEKISALIKQPSITRMDGRYPVYVILTSKEKLQEQFGESGAYQIEVAMLELVKGVEINKHWKGLIFYADQGVCLPEKFSTFKFTQAKSTDPWSIKLALVDLDSTLKKHGMVIGSVLIAGGSDVVPFHHLPNPTDDSDEDVPSDNPYGTRDQNYFIPEWPVGRLPAGIGDKDRRARFMVQTLKIYAERHTKFAVNTHTQPVLVHWVKSLSNLVLGAAPAWLYPHLKPQAFGYSAAAWKKASYQVFKTIGPSKMVVISPPTQSNTDPASLASDAKGKNKKNSSLPEKITHLRKNSSKNIRIPEVTFGYYNLHGVADAVDWYGQGENTPKGPVNPSDNQNYPVALRPKDINPNGKAVHQVVFSEACYGADHVNKSNVDSISFKFLLSGCQAFVGSTCTSYGSIDNSLEAADLLAQGFWMGIQRGLTAGEALRRSKMSLAKDVHFRQGYLGGEDQKTLISFILYGDPLAQPIKATQFPKAMTRSLKPPQSVKTSCEHGEDSTEPVIISAETFSYVRNLVAQYLPGMRDASLKIKKEKMVCETSCKRCQGIQSGMVSAKAISPRTANTPAEPPAPKHQVVILSKQISGSDHVHRQIARLTLDEKGKMVKLVVSR